MNQNKDIRERILDVLSTGMASICDRPREECDMWRGEADKLMLHFLEENGSGAVLEFPSGYVELLQWWQNQRTVKDNDFPLNGRVLGSH